MKVQWFVLILLGYLFVSPMGAQTPEIEPPLELEPEPAIQTPELMIVKYQYCLPQTPPVWIFADAKNRAQRQTIENRWTKFIAHVQNGGMWALVSYGRKSGQLKAFQTIVDFDGLVPVKESLASGPKGKRYLPVNLHSKKPHGHRGIFRVGLGHYYRNKNHRSSIWHCPMDNSLFYTNGHAVHAALRIKCYRLGYPDSHGCTRNEPKVARWRFDRVGSKPYFVIVTNDPQIAKTFGLKNRDRLKKRS